MPAKTYPEYLVKEVEDCRSKLEVFHWSEKVPVGLLNYLSWLQKELGSYNLPQYVEPVTPASKPPFYLCNHCINELGINRMNALMGLIPVGQKCTLCKKDDATDAFKFKHS